MVLRVDLDLRTPRLTGFRCESCDVDGGNLATNRTDLVRCDVVTPKHAGLRAPGDGDRSPNPVVAINSVLR
jgi:hypothetical protein